MIGLWITIYFFASLTQLSLGRTAVCTVCNGNYICGVKGYNVPECVNGHPCDREQYRLCLKMVSGDANGFLLGRNTTTAVNDDKKGQTRYRRSVASEDIPTTNSSPEDISEIFSRDVVERDFNGAAGMQYRLYGLGEKSDNETVTRTRKSVISVENVIKNIILEKKPTGTYDLEKLQADIEEQTIETLSDVDLMKVKLSISTCEDENKHENLNIPSITIIAITDCNCQNKSYRNDEKESGGNSTGKIFDYSYETYTKPSVWAESMSSEYFTSTGTLLENPVSASIVGFPENKQTVVIIESTTGANRAEWSPINQSTVGIPPTTERITRPQPTTLGRSTDPLGSDVTYSKSTEISRTTSAGTPSFKTSQSGQPLQTFSTQETTQGEIQTTTSEKTTYYFTTAGSNKPNSKPSTSTKLPTLPSFDTSQSVEDSETVFISQATRKRDEKQPLPTEKYTSDYFTTASGYIPNSKHPSVPTTSTSDAFNSSPPFLKISQSTERGTVSEKTERQPSIVEKFTSHDYIGSGSDIQDNKHSETTPSLLATGQPTEQTNKNVAFATTSAGFSASGFVSTGTMSGTTPKVSIKEELHTNYIKSTVKTSPLIHSSTLETSTAAVSTDVKTPAQTSDTIIPTPDITTVEIPSTSLTDETAATAVGPGITSHGKRQAFHCPSVGFFRDPDDCHSFYRCRKEVVNCSDCDSRTWKLTRSYYTCEDGKWFSNFFWKCVEAKPLEC